MSSDKRLAHDWFREERKKGNTGRAVRKSRPFKGLTFRRQQISGAIFRNRSLIFPQRIENKGKYCTLRKEKLLGDRLYGGDTIIPLRAAG
jgi:hypothetical protein